ncbi:(2Fe-2S)-binding protein [Engelhardtia mirabilis]|uniref:Carbon monoxide dehydrogenase small chain n=1 Tax=Engelhardtia mirabilis TaxID=2528011 RepID=A0A518BS47_9BACT|nr:Carbon monoxide dehydrogenase small chain [Planctomycetes bacterium Pla133]QDV04123.1 Carbon monoxide dehydrogenase small chain [Planctomycetes bacterium Pla86]
MAKRPREPRESDPQGPDLSRRSFLVSAGSAAAGSVLAGGLAGAATAAEAQESTDGRLAGLVNVRLKINGEQRTVAVEPRTTLLSTLRHRLDPALTGTKEVCDRGNCGACTVLVDGRPVYSCLQLACTLEGSEITTVEGLGSPDDMSDVQQAFCDKDASMCGFCTPGFVVATTACLAKHAAPDDATIRHELSGNLCRCGTYPHIFEAAASAASKSGGRGR